MYHYDDRFYVSNCPTCEVEFATKTIREMKTLEEFHECGNAKLDIALGNVVSPSENYLVEVASVPTYDARIEKPGFLPNW